MLTHVLVFLCLDNVLFCPVCELEQDNRWGIMILGEGKTNKFLYIPPRNEIIIVLQVGCQQNFRFDICKV